MSEKPKKLQILIILEAVAGLLSLGFGLFAIPLMIMMGIISGNIEYGEAAGLAGAMSGSKGSSTQFLDFLIALGVALVVFAILHFMIAYGFWKEKRWAWNLGLLFPIVGIFSLIGIYITSKFLEGLLVVIPSIIFGLIVAFYLTRSHTKTYLGKT